MKPELSQSTIESSFQNYHRRRPQRGALVLAITSHFRLVFILCMGFALWVATAPSLAHAGTKSQGTKSQGTAWVDEWLWGTRLQGVIDDPDGPGPQLVEVVGFRGDLVEMLVWRATTGWRREARAATALVGLRWLEHRCHEDRRCPRVEYRIRAVRRDESHNTMAEYADNSLDIWLYEIEFQDRTETRPSAWKPACEQGPDGATGGVFVDGHWNSHGAWHAEGYTFACTSGVIAKCVRDFGYKPWKHLHSQRTGGDVALAPLHRACVRAARADYCGDGASHTRDGTLIDMFDRYGFNVRESGTGMMREAGFSGDGAVWLERPRYDWPRCNAADVRLSESRATVSAEALITVYSVPSR